MSSDADRSTPFSRRMRQFKVVCDLSEFCTTHTNQLPRPQGFWLLPGIHIAIPLKRLEYELIAPVPDTGDYID
jgi:hypothetical protein